MAETVRVELNNRRVEFTPRHEADSKVISEIWELGTYEWEPEMLDGRAVLDLGANIGAFTLWAFLAGAARIRAVEADRANYERLMMHLNRNHHPDIAKRVEVLHAAAGPAASYRVTSAGPSSWTEPGDGIPGRTLEQLMDGLGDSVLVKCDIEGGEYDLIRSTPVPVLARIDRLALEWHTPGVEGGLGSRPWAEEEAWPAGPLIEKLTLHHRVTVQGEPWRGGLMWATRY